MSIEVRRIDDTPSMVVAHHGPIHRIRKIFETREVGIFYSEIAPGGRLPREVHKFIEVIYRISGETATIIDGKEYISRPGSFLVVPAGRWHQTLPLDEARGVSQIILATYNQITGSLLSFVEAMVNHGSAPPRMAASSSSEPVMIPGGSQR
jgi:quercetin dioxygenase-like cupin family protein